jgi:RNA polymerase sigma-70 factor, ECF subfamily
MAQARMPHQDNGKSNHTMLHEVSGPAHDLRSAADELGRGVAKACFRRKTTLDNPINGDRIVARAVARAKEGDREAVRYLYLRYSDNVYSYVRSIVHDDHEAEDITQHVFAKLMTVVGKYEQRGVPFSGWILRLAHNVAIDHLRARRATPAEEVFGSDERADESVIDMSRCLRAGLEALPEEQRKVVVLRHVVGLTPSEIATQMGRSESSIHGLHHRGRRALQEELVHMEAAPFTARPRTAVAA